MDDVNKVILVRLLGGISLTRLFLVIGLSFFGQVMTVANGQEGDGYVDTLISYSKGSGSVASPYNDPSAVLGPPDDVKISLGDGGTIVAKFEDDSIVPSGNSDIDLWVFETGQAIEPTDVFISEDGASWIYVGKTNGSTSGVDIDNYVAQEDIEYYYVKLVDLLPNQSNHPYTGADIDAIATIRNPIKERCDTVANPCQVSTGAKFYYETDSVVGLLNFGRNYHSLNLKNNGLGKGWHSPYFRYLSIIGDTLTIYSGSGQGERWEKVNGVWLGDHDSNYFVIETPGNGYEIVDEKDNVAEYDSEGRLVKETSAQLNETLYQYDTNNRLERIIDLYGAEISLSYSVNGKNHVVAALDSSGAEFSYEYDTSDNLVAVIYPDSTPNDDTDNPRKIYHYENPDFPNHLTGITDENGIRYATYAYDADGKAISTEHSQTTNAVGQERFELDYQGAN